MTTTIDTTNPHEEVTSVDIARQRLAFHAQIITAIEQTYSEVADCDDFNPCSIGLWTYHEPTHVRGLSDDVRRTCALEWLRTHIRLIQRVARRMGHDGPVTKFADDSYYGVSLSISDTVYVNVRLTAQVPAALTCEMVPTGAVDHIPARDVPVMARRCPESIFAGIEQEVA
ncbi:MAG: hypothetical protein JST64_13555 [Actinobacteria bacterium]|nr:hypothetical protein [Actinomycetota bacterium]